MMMNRGTKWFAWCFVLMIGLVIHKTLAGAPTSNTTAVNSTTSENTTASVTSSPLSGNTTMAPSSLNTTSNSTPSTPHQSPNQTSAAINSTSTNSSNLTASGNTSASVTNSFGYTGSPSSANGTMAPNSMNTTSNSTPSMPPLSPSANGSSTGYVSGSTVYATAVTGTGIASTGTGSGSAVTATGTGSSGAGVGSTGTGTGSSGAGTDSTGTGTGTAGMGTDSTGTGTGTAEKGADSTGTGTGATGIGADSTGTGAGLAATGTTPSTNGSPSSSNNSTILTKPVTQGISLRFTDIPYTDALCTPGTPQNNDLGDKIKKGIDSIGKSTMPKFYIDNTAKMCSCYQGSVIVNSTFNTTLSNGDQMLANNIIAAGSNGTFPNMTLDLASVVVAVPPNVTKAAKGNLATDKHVDIENTFIPDRAVINPPYLTLVTLPSLLGLLFVVIVFMLATAGRDACLCQICSNNQAKEKLAP